MGRTRGRRNPRRVTGQEPLSYMGVEATQPPEVIVIGNDPTAANNNFDVGTIWINFETADVWILTNIESRSAVWTPINSPEFTVTTDAGTVTSVDDNVNLVGSGVLTTAGATDTVTLGMTAAADGSIIVASTGLEPEWATLTSTGGTITVTGGPNTLNVDIVGGYLGAQVFNTDVGAANIVGNAIEIAGGTNINTSGAGGTVTINLDTAIVVDDITASNLGDGVVFSSAAGVFSSAAGTNGQLVIGATGASPIWANLASAGGTVAITEGANSINLESLPEPTPYLIEKSTVAASTADGYLHFGTTYSSIYGVWIIAARETAGINKSRIYTSPDRINWTIRDETIGGIEMTNVSCGADGKCVCWTAQIGTIYTSNDPTAAWSAINVIGAPPPQAPTVARRGPTYWVLSDGVVDGVWTAPDPTVGAGWTFNAAGITNIINGLAYGAGLWVGVAAFGGLYTAVDPTAPWTGRTSSFSGTGINSVDYSASLGIFCAVGDAGKIATSPDGITWTQRVNSFDIVGIHTVSWDATEAIFVAISTNEMGFSKDGINWWSSSKLGLLARELHAEDSTLLVVSNNDTEYITQF